MAPGTASPQATGPATIKPSGIIAACGSPTTPAPPGSAAAQRPTAIIQSMPSPITARGQGSSPKGMASAATTAAGMITRPVTGKTAMLARIE